MARTFRLRDLLARMFPGGGSGIDLDAVVLIDVDGDSRPVIDAFTFTDFDGDRYTGSGLVVQLGHDVDHQGGYAGQTPEAIAFHEREAPAS